MNVIKLTLAAATLSVGLAASASAMPLAPLGTVDVGGVKTDQVRLVCNRWGRCWRTGGYYGFYRGGYRRGYGAYGRGYRHW